MRTNPLGVISVCLVIWFFFSDIKMFYGVKKVGSEFCAFVIFHARVMSSTGYFILAGKAHNTHYISLSTEISFPPGNAVFKHYM